MLSESKKKKKGMWDVPIWLIWSLIALVVALLVLGLSSGKMSSFFGAISNLFNSG